MRHALMVETNHANTLTKILFDLRLGADRELAPIWFKKGANPLLKLDTYRAGCIRIINTDQIGIVSVHTNNCDPLIIVCAAFGQRGTNRRNIVHGCASAKSTKTATTSGQTRLWYDTLHRQTGGGRYSKNIAEQGSR